MKHPRLVLAILCSIVGLIAAPTLRAQDASAAAPAAAPQMADMDVLTGFGYTIGQRIGITNLELNEAERAAVIKGLTAAFAGEKLNYNPEQLMPEVQRVLGGKAEVQQGKAAAKAKVAADAYFADLKKDTAIQFTASGLGYKVTQEGDGKTKPVLTDTVKVHYTGKLTDGTVFDSSVERGEPAEFPLNGVIPGWTEGLQLLSKGGKATLYIPAALGYGEAGAGDRIPPGSALVFDVELLDVKAPAAEGAPAAE
jgi:FKBP-type peptidyl-prolyl cis-trans isomerase